MLKCVIFSHGDKGGVGKSTVATAIIDLLLEAGRKVALLDGDVDNADVAQRYQNSGIKIGRVRMSDPSEYQTAVNGLAEFIAAATESADVIVVNLPANASSTIDEEPEIFVDLLVELEIDLRVVISAGNSRSAVENLKHMLARGIAAQSTALVLAPAHIKDPTLAERLRTAGVETVREYPRMPPDTMAVVLAHPHTPLLELEKNPAHVKSVIQRLRIGQYRRAAARALDPLLHDLIASAGANASASAEPEAEAA